MNTLKYFLYDWGGYNKIISQYIHSSIVSKPLIIFFKSITQMGDIHFFPLHLALVSFVLFIMLRKNKNNTIQQGISYIKCLSLLLLNVLAVVVVIETMKRIFQYPRPYCVFDFNMKEYLMYLFKYPQKSCHSSFPSGHTAYVCAFIISFWQILNRNLKAIGIFLIVFVGISRIILGKHFIADTIYSYLIVLFVINPLNNLFIIKYFPRYRNLIKGCLKKIL